MPQFGIFRGTLTDVSDLGIGRVRVSVPQLGISSATGPVVYSCSAPWSLQVGTSVIVAFEGGDTNRLVVLGTVDS